jgi:phage terminase small subunit
MTDIIPIDEDFHSSGLSPKQERFCFLVSQGLNATEAYRQAKYKVKTDGAAKSAASRLLTNVNVKAFIKYLRDKAVAATIADLVEVKQGLTEVVRSRVSDFLQTDTEGVVKLKVGPETLNTRAIQEVNTETIFVNDSPIKTQVSKLKLRDPIPAARLLAELSGWTKEQEPTVNDNRQINIIVQSPEQAKEMGELIKGVANRTRRLEIGHSGN